MLNSFSMQSGLTTLAPGAYVVLVSDYAAFNFRYNIAANDIPVAGVYTGHQSNSGELIALYEAGPANPTTGFVPYYQTDLVDYSDAAPWPTQASRRRAVADSSPPGRLRQRSRQLDGEQRRRHARRGEHRLRSAAADRANQFGCDRQRGLQHDQPLVDRFDRHAQRCRSL